MTSEKIESEQITALKEQLALLKAKLKEEQTKTKKLGFEDYKEGTLCHFSVGVFGAHILKNADSIYKGYVLSDDGKIVVMTKEFKGFFIDKINKLLK